MLQRWLICAAVGVPMRIGGIAVGAADIACALNIAEQQDNRMTDLRMDDSPLGRRDPSEGEGMRKWR
jgi:hypothetical protein